MPASSARWIQIVLIGGLAAWLAIAAISWASDSPLGDNESLYARAAQQQLDGESPRWNYLSRGMIAVAAPGVLAGGSERALRLVPLLLGIGFVIATAYLARRTFGNAAAAWLVVAVAATKCISRRGADLLSDLPSAGCLLLGIAILIGELERSDGPRWRIVAAAPALAAGLYLRYGSCIPIAIAAVVLAAFYARVIVRNPAPVIATAVVFVVLLVPHAIHATIRTGSPLGFLFAGNEVLRVEYRGVGLVGFIAKNPLTYYGFTAPLAIVGLASIIRRRDRMAVALWLIAVGQIVAIGMTTVAENRYIVLALVLLLLLGIDAVLRAIAGLSNRARTAIGAGSAIGLLACSILIALTAARAGPRHRAELAPVLSAAAVIERDAGGRPCQVVARHTNQLEWYSGCEASLEVPAQRRELLYVVRVLFGGYQPAVEGLSMHVLVERPDLLVVRVDP